MKRWVVIAILAFAVGFALGYQQREEKEPQAETKTIVRVDTLSVEEPEATDTKVVGYVPYPSKNPKGAASDSTRDDTSATGQVTAESDSVGDVIDDSQEPMLAVLQRHYSDSLYEAWVSGCVDPRLDSIRIYSRVTEITRTIKEPQRRWHIGVSAGYGYGAKGFQPYIGVGVTYSLFSF